MSFVMMFMMIIIDDDDDDGSDDGVDDDDDGDDDNEATSCSYRQRVHASRLVQMQVGAIDLLYRYYQMIDMSGM